MSTTDVWQDAQIDWAEKERFHEWIKANTPALRRRIAKIQQDNPSSRHKRGIVIASYIYMTTGGVPLYD